MATLPYRYAHYPLLLLLPLSVVAFGNYVTALGEAGLAKHVHALAATLWILLLAAQNALIHNRSRRMHRLLGTGSLLLFPIYCAGFMLVFQSEAQRIADGDPWAGVFGPGIGAMTLIALLSTAWMYYSGLRERRNPQLHARWMLVTVFLFAESVLGRLLNNYVPGLIVYEFADVRKIYDAFHVSQLLAIGLALVLYAANRQYGRPFLFVSVVLVLQSISLELFDGFEPWRTLFVAMSDWPVAVFAGGGLLLGVAVAVIGWRRGARRQHA